MLAAGETRFPPALGAAARRTPRLVLWAILYYVQLGLDDDALTLSRGHRRRQRRPDGVLCGRALALQQGDRQQAQTHIQAAERHSTAGVFPDSTAVLSLLQGLAPHFPEASRLDYYTGLVLASLGGVG